MGQRLLLSFFAVLVWMCALPGQAGPLPASAQNLGRGVSSIVGNFDLTEPPNEVAAMFKIDITDYQDFSAISVNAGPFGAPDTELFLFDANGNGVYGNDDISATNTLACLPSNASSNPCPLPPPPGVGPTSDGIYYLAITLSANGPVSVDGEIFTILNSTDVVGPDLTMGGGSPITDWDGNIFTNPNFDLNAYDIALQGVVPEPGTLTLLAVGLGLLARRRQDRIR